MISIYDVTLDYIVKIKWNEETRTWTRTVEQVSSTGNTKVLDTKDNITAFFNKGQSYVNFSLDLGLLNYPNQCKLIFFLGNCFHLFFFDAIHSEEVTAYQCLQGYFSYCIYLCNYLSYSIIEK